MARTQQRSGWFAAALTLAITSTAAAQVGPVVLSLPGNTRALALGNSYPVNAADADAIFYNPALLLTARGHSLSLQKYGGSGTLASFSSAMDANFGFGVQVLDYSVTRNAPNILGSPLTLGESGGTHASEAVAAIGYARTIKRIRLGAAGKWAQHFGSGSSSGVAAFDVGALANPISWLTLALAGRNLGGDFEFEGQEYDLPSSVVLNATTRSKVLGEFDSFAAGRIEHDLRGDFSGSLGVELSYWPFSGLTFFGRGGARFGGQRETQVTFCPIVPPCQSTTYEQATFTAGGGITYRRVTVDYAWESFEGTSSGHRIGLKVR